MATTTRTNTGAFSSSGSTPVDVSAGACIWEATATHVGAGSWSDTLKAQFKPTGGGWVTLATFIYGDTNLTTYPDFGFAACVTEGQARWLGADGGQGSASAITNTPFPETSTTGTTSDTVTVVSV